MVVVNYWYLAAGPTPFANPIPATHKASFPEPDLFAFTDSGELSYHVVVRERLQELEDEGTIEVVGAWDVNTGQPMGGVGSPWFVTPEGFDTSSQRILDGGQVPRIFI